MFYWYYLRVLTQRHLTAWVNSGWFWKRHGVLIQIVKWPPEASGTTDRKTNSTLTHLTPIPQVTMRQLDLFDMGFLFHLYVIFLIAYAIDTGIWRTCVLQKPVTTACDSDALVVTEAVLTRRVLPKQGKLFNMRGIGLLCFSFVCAHTHTQMYRYLGKCKLFL